MSTHRSRGPMLAPIGPIATRRSTRTDSRSGFWLAGAVVLMIDVGLLALGNALGLGTITGLVAIPVMLLALVPILRYESGAGRGFDSAGLVFFAFSVKVLGAFGRLYMVDEIYDGNGDSSSYHLWGTRLAESFRGLDFDVDPGRPIPGTGFIRVSTGVIYALVGTNKFVGFLVYSMLGFIGVYLLFVAFATAVPTGHLKRYGLLIFLWPTMSFWPSAIGKEAWMMFALGLGAWGTSRLLVHKRGGVTALVVGLLAMYAVRPHVAILLVAAVAVGVIINALFRSGDGVRSFGFASKMGSVVLLVVLASLLAPRVATFLNVDDVGGSGFSSALESVQARTDEGGSNFDAADIDSIVDYPWAFITVIFRPFPWEVTNAQSAVTALEGLVLAGLLFFSIRRLARLPVEAIKRPYAAAAAAYVFMFCYVFAFVGNFGILARQRSQLLPFVFVLVALPLTERARTRARPGPYPRDGGGSDDGPSAEGGETDRPSGESARARQSGLNIVTAGIGPPSRRR